METFLPDLPDHPAPLRPPRSKVSSRTASHVSSSQQQQPTNTQLPKTLLKPFTQQPPPTFPKPSPDVQPQLYSQPAQPPPTYPKPFTQTLQTQEVSQRFIQSLPRPYLQTASSNALPKAQVPLKTPPIPQSLPQPLVKSKSLPLAHKEDFSRQSVLSGDPKSPAESGDTLTDEMCSKQMSIKER